MPSNRRKRDLGVFILGTILGILGNFFVEFFLAWTYPQGIPQMAAQGGTIVMGIFIIIYVILIGDILTKD